MAGTCVKNCRRNIRNGNNRVGHCPNCHNDFSGITAYDIHLTRDKDTGKVSCKNLDTLQGWFDERGVWHAGEKLTAEQRAEIWLA